MAQQGTLEEELAQKSPGDVTSKKSSTLPVAAQNAYLRRRESSFTKTLNESAKL